MHSRSVLKTVICVIATAALLMTTSSTTSAQEFFSGRGLSGNVLGGNPFQNPLAPQFDQPPSNPLAGLFKKPAFLENLKLPTLNKSPADSGQQSLLGKMKTKTDAFFSKALALEKLLPGRQQNSTDPPSWESVRKSMEGILAEHGEQNPIRSADRSGNLLNR